MPFHVIVIGAGSTGAATAHDLALRGLQVTVVERGNVASGTSGRNHTLLHSGGRYAMRDAESARECIEENLILRRILPEALELNGGLFVALTEEELSYKETFLEACAQVGIPAREISREEALRRVPHLNPRVLAAVAVPDGVFEPYRFCAAFLATAQANGAEIRTYTEVIDVVFQGRSVAGVRVRDRRTGREEVLGADLVVNAAGPWGGRVAALAGATVPVVPTAGVMISVGRRWTHLVLNRLRPASDGDILVPQRHTSIIGTTSWPVENPDHIPIPEDHVRFLLQAGEELIPGYVSGGIRGIFAVARPLIRKEDRALSGREISRTFQVFDHRREGIEGLISVAGGKMTTARAMAEKVADVVCARLGVDAPCRTREVPLRPARSLRPFHGR